MSSPAAVGRSGPHGRGGYSLAELVLALGVLAIGMTMAAALFPTAIKLNERSNRDSVGTLIAANGLALARGVVRPADLTGTNLQPLQNAVAFQAKPWLLKYPADPNAGPTTRGYLPLGRPLKGTYQLVIVAYDRQSPDPNSVQAIPVTINNVDPIGAGGATSVKLTNPSFDETRCKDTPLICAPADPNDPRIAHARMTYDLNSRSLLLDHPITNEVTTGWTSFVIVEVADGSTDILLKSPVMMVLVGETTLEGGP